MEENAIVRQEEQTGISAATFGQVFTTCKLEDEAGKFAVLRALNDAESLAENVPDNAVLEVIDFVVTPGVRRARQQGAPDVECLNVYILTKDGGAYMTQSDGIAKSVEQINALFPNGPRSAAAGFLKLQVRNRKLPNGNTLKTLVPVD